jgi:hypothetical protein
MGLTPIRLTVRWMADAQGEGQSAPQLCDAQERSTSHLSRAGIPSTARPLAAMLHECAWEDGSALLTYPKDVRETCVRPIAGAGILCTLHLRTARATLRCRRELAGMEERQ